MRSNFEDKNNTTKEAESFKHSIQGVKEGSLSRTVLDEQKNRLVLKKLLGVTRAGELIVSNATKTHSFRVVKSTNTNEYGVLEVVKDRQGNFVGRGKIGMSLSSVFEARKRIAEELFFYSKVGTGYCIEYVSPSVQEIFDLASGELADAS